jgi:hypothetical protein
MQQNNNNNNGANNRRVRKPPSRRMQELTDALRGAHGYAKVGCLLHLLLECAAKKALF